MYIYIYVCVCVCVCVCVYYICRVEYNVVRHQSINQSHSDPFNNYTIHSINKYVLVKWCIA